ncbi:AfsR/SARP family transcriptional regulator [Streptomyces sp. NPDC020719]|uniref:AfsR/SARP family transcriptional regulator n=1 Tax=unclassified Streptomyces TaxID=2593676 RepID=UPI0033EA4BCB
MEIEVLGPLKVQIDGVSIVPSAGKPRQLLALLALRAGRIVPVPTLMEEIWGEHIPRSAQTTLQTYVLQLRRLVTKAIAGRAELSAKDVLATRFGSYQLNGPVMHFDFGTFQERSAAGREALAAGEDAKASALLAEALDLWQGPALADVPAGSVLETEIIGMNEARTRAHELRIEADLRLGRHGELLGELLMLTAQHPLNEIICGHLITALYRAGHTWRALEAFQRLRTTLVSELGVEPSPRVQRLHQQVLGSGPTPRRQAA